MVKNFSRCKMEYKKDEHGKEILLKDGKFQVMMEWEKPYMQACIDALRPFGDVLEVGFGLGYSANHIQQYHPNSHTIIEYHPEVAARAREWAKQYPHVNIIEDTWQNALSKLGVFDCVFFDDYPLQSESQMQNMQKESANSQLLLKKGEKVLREAEKALPFLAEIKYSDEDIYAFIQEISSQEKLPIEQVVRFLKELCDREQISHEQLRTFLNTLIEEKKFSQEEVEHHLEKLENKIFTSNSTNERFFVFLKQCLDVHMRKEARLSCFLSSPSSKYSDQRFIDEVITNPNIDFHEEEIQIDVPENCDYFSGNKALVITIIKKV